jgi:hypothetical protein
MDMAASPLILVPGVLGETDDTDLTLPRRDHNLFERIIRNPLPPGSTPKERECAEMLCAVLQNAPGIRYGLMAWLGEFVGYDGVPFDELDLHIETEQSVYGKRDDLRITGLYSDSEDEAVALLWTIEIKVGAPFHFGSSVVYDGEEEDGGSEDVSQIANYDYWLTDQEAAHKAGFILSISDRSEELPRPLTNTWRCVLWSQMAAQVRRILDSDDQLADIDVFLGSHLLGFTHYNFGEEGENMDDYLDFDDIAFLRAFGHVGARAEVRVQNLVEGLRPVLEEVAVGVGTIRSQKNLFRKWHRYMLFQHITESDDSQAPRLFVGMQIGPVPMYRLWIEMSPRYTYRDGVYNVMSSHQEELSTPQSQRRLVPLDSSSWQQLLNELPLEKLLSKSDQQLFLAEYTGASLIALKESGLTDEIRRIVQE